MTYFIQKTHMGNSYFTGYKDYQEWETLIKSIKKTLPSDSPLLTIYQTSEFWTKVSLTLHFMLLIIIKLYLLDVL